jgi:hypothetical protein
LPTDISVQRAFFAKKRYTEPDTSSSCLSRDGTQAGLHVRHVEIEIAGVASRHRNSARSGRVEEFVLLRRVGNVSTPACGLHLVIADILADALENTGQRFRFRWSLLCKSRSRRAQERQTEYGTRCSMHGNLLQVA